MPKSRKQKSDATGLSPAASSTSVVKRKLVDIDAATDAETETKEKKPKRRRKKNPDNGSYNRKTYGKKKKKKTTLYRGRKHNIRANAAKTFTVNNKEEKIRTTIVVDAKTLRDNVEFMDPDALKKYLNKAFREKLEKNEHFRDIDKVLEYSATGTPIKVKLKTPTKKSDQTNTQNTGFDPLIAYRVSKVGPFSYYSNVPSETPLNQLVIVTDIDQDADFFDSVSYHSIKEFKEAFKERTLEISEESIENLEKKDSRNQNKKMVKKGVSDKLGSATQYAQSSELFVQNVKWEWLHLICYEVYGEDGQKAKNMVCGTDPANTEMITVESQLHKLVAKYPDGFTLRVKGNVIEGTQLGTTIEYSIVTPDFTLPLTFNAQTTNTMHGSFHYFYSFFIDSLIEAVDKHKQQQQQQQISPPATPDVNTAKNPYLLFSKQNSQQPLTNTINATDPTADLKDDPAQKNEDPNETSKSNICKKLKF